MNFIDALLKARKSDSGIRLPHWTFGCYVTVKDEKLVYRSSTMEEPYDYYSGIVLNTTWEVVSLDKTSDEKTLKEEKPKSNGMNVIEAMNLLKQGERVHRKGWTHDSYYEKDEDGFIRAYAGSSRSGVKSTSGLRVEMNMTDMLATDWAVYAPATMSFTEAFAKYKEGYTIKRLEDKRYFKRMPADQPCFTPVDVQATDWIVVD